MQETALRTFTKCSVAQMISEQNVASISGYRLDVSLRYVIQKQTIEEGLKVMVSQYWKVILGLDDHEAFMLHICDLCDLYHDPFGETSISPHRSYPCGDRTSVVKSVGIPGWNPGTETVPVAKKHIQISDFCWRPISYPCRHVSAFEIHQLYQNSGISMHHFVVFFTPEIPKVWWKSPKRSAPSSMTVPSSKPSQENTAGSWSRSQKKSLTDQKSAGMFWGYGYVLCVLFSHFLGYWLMYSWYFAVSSV